MSMPAQGDLDASPVTDDRAGRLLRESNANTLAVAMAGVLHTQQQMGADGKGGV